MRLDYLILLKSLPLASQVASSLGVNIISLMRAF